MKRKSLLSSLLILILMVLAACQPVSRAWGFPGTGSSSTLQPGKTQVAVRETQVQNVTIQVVQTEPAQVNAVVSGFLTESCAKLEDPQVSYASNTFQITLLTVSPSDRGCAQSTTPFEKTIPLDLKDLPAGKYMVIANGVGAAFTLPFENKQSTLQPSAEPIQTKTYTSTAYHYQFSYPSDWSIAVNTSVPSDAGANPEYITLTTNDPSNLPAIDIDVLTNTPPMLGFEDCEKNFVFRDIPACKLSLPAGQNPAAELLIFQKDTAYFFIAMRYQDIGSKHLFNDFITSFEFTD